MLLVAAIFVIGLVLYGYKGNAQRPEEKTLVDLARAEIPVFPGANLEDAQYIPNAVPWTPRVELKFSFPNGQDYCSIATFYRKALTDAGWVEYPGPAQFNRPCDFPDDYSPQDNTPPDRKIRVSLHNCNRLSNSRDHVSTCTINMYFQTGCEEGMKATKSSPSAEWSCEAR